MPTTAQAALVIALALMPGLPADTLYRVLVGADWRRPEWERIITVLFFSVVGLVVYILFAPTIGLPIPTHVFPSTFEPQALTAASLPGLATAVVGHIVFSSLVGLTAGWALRLATRWSPTSVYPAAWDAFVRSFVPDHWVVTTLTNGQSYAGILKVADVSVAGVERDIVLSEPALFSKEKGQYFPTRFQHIFIPAVLVSSVAAVYNEDVDKRISPIDQPLFHEVPHE